MREIKFRAWDKIENKMVAIELWNTSLECRYDFMQYTGIIDKQGVEIYYGDIIKDGSGLLYQIVWQKKNARFAYKCEMNSKSKMNQKQDIEDGIEVVGNIYENHELLK